MEDIPKNPIPPNSTLSAFWPKKVTQITEIPHTHTHAPTNTPTLTNAVQKSTQDKDEVHSRKTRCRSMMKNSRQVRDFRQPMLGNDVAFKSVNRYFE